MADIDVIALSTMAIGKGKPVLTEEHIEDFALFEVDNLTVGIIEHGPIGGNSIVSLSMKNPDNKSITTVQLTDVQFIELAKFFNGAIQQFVNEKAACN